MIVSFQEKFLGKVLKGLYHNEEQMMNWIDKEAKRKGISLTMLPRIISAYKEAAHPKTQTIRRLRKGKRQIHPGDNLQLYAFHRTPMMMMLGVAECTEVAQVRMDRRAVNIGGICIDWAECHEIAQKDGFEHPIHMSTWFQKEHGLPFEGVVIKWQPNPQKAPLLSGAP